MKDIISFALGVLVGLFLGVLIAVNEKIHAKDTMREVLREEYEIRSDSKYVYFPGNLKINKGSNTMNGGKP